MQANSLNNSIKRKKRVNKDVFFYSALLILPLIQICVFYFGVNFQSIMMAFQYYRATPTPGGFEWGMKSTIERFKQEINLNDGMLWPMIGNSVTVWIITSLVGTLLAVFFAYYIYKKNVGSNFFKLFLFSFSNCFKLFFGVGKSSGIVPPASLIAFLTIFPILLCVLQASFSV